jgi:DNA replication licensing factor MCM5
MNGFDAPSRPYAVSIASVSKASSVSHQTGGLNQQKSQHQKRFLSFIQNFRKNENEYVYRDKLRTNILRKEYQLQIELEDLRNFDEELEEMLRKSPGEMIPLVSFILGRLDANLTR